MCSCTYILLLRFCLNIRAKSLYYHFVREHRGVLNSRVLVAIKSQFWVLITALFKNTRTLKFKSCLRHSVFGCRQHNYDHKQRTYEETHKADRNPPITNFCFLRDPLIWLTAVKYANVSWLLNFRIHVFLKSAVRGSLEKPRVGEIGILLKDFIGSFLKVK